MRRVIVGLVVFCMFFVGNVEASVSESFSKVLSLMNVPQSNKDGYVINEEIYNKYNLIVYGKPQDVSKNQRWKDVVSREMGE